MGHIKTRTLSDGKTKRYLARWIDPAGDECTQQFRLKGDAQKHLDEIEGSKARGTYIDPRHGDVTVREYFEKWSGLQVHRVLTRVNVTGNFRNHVLPLIGDRRIASVRRSDIQAIVSALIGKGLRGSTIRVVMAGVKALFADAVLNRCIAETPYVRIALPDASTGKIAIPTVAQIRAISGKLPENMRAMPIVAAGTGLRISELIGLQVEAIDFTARTVSVPERDAQLAYERETWAPHLAPPKSKASERVVPVGSVVIDALSVHLDAGHSGKANLPDQDGHSAFRHLVFTTPKGEAWYRNGVSKAIARATDGMGLPPRSAWHWYRHFYASALIAAGEDPKTIQTRMGHGSITETFNTYGHLFPDTEDRSRKAIDDAFGEDD